MFNLSYLPLKTTSDALFTGAANITPTTSITCAIALTVLATTLTTTCCALRSTPPHIQGKKREVTVLYPMGNKATQLNDLYGKGFKSLSVEKGKPGN